MKEDYIIAFSSFYKAVYAQEILLKENIRSKVRKLPPELIKSCGYALYLSSDKITQVENILYLNDITTKGIFKEPDNKE